MNCTKKVHILYCPIGTPKDIVNSEPAITIKPKLS